MAQAAFARPLVLVSLLALAVGCEAFTYAEGDEAVADWEASLSTVEDFEAGSKSAYAAGNVTFASGSWNLSDALIGATGADVTDGAKAVRVRNSGTVTMSFDRTAGAGTVSVKHASYGSDANGAFALYWSQDGGSTWTKTGANVTTAPDTLATASFTVNRSGTIRFQLRKLGGASSRINLDDVAITDYGASPDAGPTTPPPSTPPPGSSVSVHTKLGLPSAASTSNWNDYLSVKSQYVLSYNSSRKVPNWVSWELSSAYLGSAPRQNDYRTDNTLPAGMPQATLADYSGSGWDRGHMCPSGDRTKTTSANSQTFYLSNMVPQAGNNNGGPWDDLEAYSRALSGQGKGLYVISGGVFSSSSGTIGNGGDVPDATFKVVVVLDQPGQGAASVTSSTRVIGVLVPNDDGEVSGSDDWKPYRVSVREIESLTGLNFLSDVSPSVQNVVETRVDSL